MKRITLGLAAGLLALTALPESAEARADFDAALGALHLTKDALATFDFETPGGLVGAQLTTWVKNDESPTLLRTPIVTGDEIAAMLTAGLDDAVEGGHALRLGKDGTGLAIVDPDLFARVADGRFEVTAWARGDGTALQLSVVYDNSPDNLVVSGAPPFASVRAVRTGRETTDGWAEYSTGALDGSVWGVPARAILLLPSYASTQDQSFLVDALEIRKTAGKPSAPHACTMQTAAAVCGAEGDCMFGHCVPSSVTWGVLPSLAHRREIADRWVHYSTRLIGDRNASHNGQAILTPAAHALAESSLSSRQFFGGLNRLVNLLRDNHTSFGSPSNITSFAPQLREGSSSVLGACFGVVDKDLLGGGLGYAVFRAAETPLTGVPLQRGDVLFAIDGRDPKQWVDEVWPQVSSTLPNDPSSDWGASANSLSRLIATRASTVTLIRCASAAACTGASRQTITIDVATAAFSAVSGAPAPTGTTRAFGCTPRFLDSVTAKKPASDGEDPVVVEAGGIGETRVQFDGFVGQKKWEASMTSIFAPSPARVMMDARMGHGGYYSAVQHLFDLVRGTSEPIGVVSLGRGTYDPSDPPWLFSRLGKCSDARPDFWSCYQGNANGFFASKAAPPGAATKIAWLNTYDVSANDFMPRLLKGRSNVKIFAPHPTSGAFGAIVTLPGLWTGWTGGSMQIQDARFGPNLASVASARWESGHGVEPDVLVVQKLSDALGSVDTIVQTAATWLGTP